MPIHIAVADRRWSRLKGLHEKIDRAHEATLPRPQARQMVSLLLADDPTLQALNKQWRRKNNPTNVLSFPAARINMPRGSEKMLGDIAISYDTVKREAAAARITIADHAVHLVVHGMLHLVGHDHEMDAQALRMERTERRILAELGIADPYVVKDPHE